ncbi:MAG: alpha-amylase/4-alpha-glucanotransferase domain-containing protein [Candidatus Omnitrophota bacterium]
MNSKNGINLMMAVHSHQPDGNFEWVFAEAFEKSYLPFLKMLYRYPGIRASLHYSGCLLDWISEKRPEFIEMLKDVAKRGQVEMLSGGYYEPILSLIPERDILGQIKLMNEKIEKFTGCVPKGIWLTERVWEPTLIRPLEKAGIKYAIVDDWHFTYVGRNPDELSGYYVTEDEGRKLFIFPGSEKLRYMMPFKLPHEAINYMREQRDRGVNSKIFADDGEKFGIWPGTHKWVYEEKWLENFLNSLNAESGWLKTTTFSDYIRDNGPTDRIYLTCASYREMMEWSGGYFKNFLVKYPESNAMQKKMLYVSERVAKAKSKKAEQYLYKGQCNCAYWHGVFGGLYLNHLRAAVYSNLIQSEKIMDGLEHKGSDWVDVETVDIDCDSHNEVLISTSKLNLNFAPHEGGSLFEIDFKPFSLNLANTLARRKEPYHQKALEKAKIKAGEAKASEGIASIHNISNDKDADLVSDLKYDWYRKACLLDHFFDGETTVKDYTSSSFREAGDFLRSGYDFSLKKPAKTNDVILRLARDGNCLDKFGENHKIRIVKTIYVKAIGSAFEMEYEISNLGSMDFNSLFGAEFNYSLKDPHLNRAGEAQGLRNISVNDQWYGLFVDFEFSKPASMWYFPVETVSDSESGLERTYQELSLLFNWNLRLAPNESWKVNVLKNIRIKK